MSVSNISVSPRHGDGFCNDGQEVQCYPGAFCDEAFHKPNPNENPYARGNVEHGGQSAGAASATVV